ncbi:unnamed protein product [Tetraodon nigroviridis]|uniref:Glycosyltransferase family 92 protein n=2 Tax=Tetraodon nigroviridis TaxID=99883 RepID=Q4RMQ2_TETNG|nr:unnamed protein product [Tetraodon nigroviridis]
MAKIKIFVALVPIWIVICIYYLQRLKTDKAPVPKPRRDPRKCPLSISNETITPLDKHLLVSAYMDQRVTGLDLRIIGIFKRDSIQALYCLFCCKGHMSTTTNTTILQHSDNFGFPYVTTDVMCAIPKACSATHVSLVRELGHWTDLKLTWLPIRNIRSIRAEERFNFTVCISTLFGGYNNVLQFAQSLEMYRLLGVNRVVIYKNSCSPELDRLLHGYSQEGFVEMVQWPIDQYLTPSKGWLFSESGGDVHYYGQQTTLNECIYRSMDRSRYVLLNDIDEIVMPYQHSGLMPLMDTLLQQHPKAAVFLIENRFFPKNHFEPSGKFKLTRWSRVPGVNILEHIYLEEPDRNVYHPHKMIIKPRMVEQTSVHEPLKHFGEQVKVPPNVAHLIHTRVGLREGTQLTEDTRLWNFSEELIAGVDKALRRAGLLGQADEPESHTVHPNDVV